ncbi:response regulator [Noviherbaspirillum sp. CPCC 100848]|uniref:Response regulator n=1 Tax=Noviherbaspirillum album TaxID=3080276 RepID=A0ABU6J9R8_9BURK|nr:response regulator [Noviherbaspirillum sp. CPCC 100848]MEC4720027.1 response regulator [Noviherbaspirillum sp. CPCC 100848]
MNHKVLLVEDDTMIGENIVIGLELEDISVVWIQDGQLASDMLADTDFSAAILDFGLPGKSGYELLQEIRARNDAMPIMIITALESSHVRERCLNAGANFYLNKPFDLDELIGKLRLMHSIGVSEAFPYGVIRRVQN